jgi:hypothetical protein
MSLDKERITDDPCSQMIRDQFSITTWLSIGAILQGALFLVGGRLAFLPALSLLVYRALESYAVVTGWKSNPWTAGTINQITSAQFPDELGHYGPEPANTDVVVLLIGSRSNSPLGLLAPGYKQMGEFFSNMVKDLEASPEEYGFLGMTSWLNASDRTTQSELMQVAYFKTVEGLHAFAQGPEHRKAMEWWGKTVKEHGHLAIWHEIYHAPKGHWENIYINSHRSGIMSTTHKIFDEASGTEMWASPIVEAGKGVLKSSAQRMGRREADADLLERGVEKYYKV